MLIRITYIYDTRGNILSKTTTAADGTVTTDSYGYTDSKWADRLTSYNGIAINYDEIGNPLNWVNGATLTWEHGRQLSSHTTGVFTTTYQYNSDGIRTSKNYFGFEYNYHVVDGTLRRMTTEGQTLEFVYGNGLNSVIYNGTEYWYVFNAQGDVIGLIDANGEYVVEYTYDAWGKILSKTGTMANSLGVFNPFRYRGYIYDEESGLYYVSSRYYDPAVGRWINADGYVGGIGAVQGYNLFACCFNNPVNMSDPTGNWPKWIEDAANWVNNNIIQPVKNFFSPSTSVVAATANSLPSTGEPGSSQTLPNPDGTPKQKRWYGPDGDAVRDRDYNHPGEDIPFPHDHEWKDGQRQKDHLPPSPDYEFSLDPVLGVGLVTICAIGIAVVAIDDATGVGVADDFLFAPLGAGFTSGLTMIFG